MQTQPQAEPTIQSYFDEVVAFLPGWKTAPGSHSLRCFLIHEETLAQVAITLITRKKCYHLTCVWPSRTNRFMDAQMWGVISRDEKEPEIRFSIDKSPEDAANGINRRLLSLYLPLYLKAVQKHEAEGAKLDYMKHSAYMLTQSFHLRDFSPLIPFPEEKRLDLIHTCNDIQGKVVTPDGDTFTVELIKVPKDKLIEILKIVQS